MIDSSRVGVKFPLTGSVSGVSVGVTRGVMVGTGVADGFIVGVGVGDGIGVGVRVILGVGVGVAELEATKAGTSPACTTKFLVSVLVIPDASSQEMVIE